MQTQITWRCVIEKKTEELGEKPLRCLPSDNRSTRQSIRIHWLARDPPSLIYPMYLSPPSSYSNKASRNRVLSSSSDPATSSMSHPSTLASSNASHNTKNTHYTLKMCGLCLGTNLPSRYDNGRGNEKRLQLILTKDE